MHRRVAGIFRYSIPECIKTCSEKIFYVSIANLSSYIGGTSSEIQSIVTIISFLGELAMADSLKYEVHQYGEHELQRVGVWDLDSEDKTKYWIIYIHGGAWRDPRITHTTFAASITHILQQHPPVAGFASIDYRLSPHPDFPQDPASTPPSQYRGAQHPDHVHDVQAALRFLDHRYGLEDRYLLLGHSAGACLAFQVLTCPPLPLPLPALPLPLPGALTTKPPANDQAIPEEPPTPPLPSAILGLEGIYDMRGLNTRVSNSYTGFLTAAFGPDPSAWDAAAPMKYAGDYGAAAPGLRLAAVAHSLDDELVDVLEAEGMAARLRRDGVAVLLAKDLSGSHDEVWRDGEGVGRMVGRVLEILGVGR
ncbi:alpha/beta-hydrolase [Hypoxylon sp. NC1633]|nr:alpha/beta-hydrolase [Hypoxylon sp. NC1633]